MNAFRKFLDYLPLIVARPFAAVDSLAQEKGVRVGFVPMAVYASLAVIHNIVQGLLYGWDYLGTSPLLTNPTFVGAFGATVSLLWSTFVIGVYSIATYTWIIVLSTIAIRRVQQLSYTKAAAASIMSFLIAMFLYSTFVR